MSRYAYDVVDLRPVATHGWTVATVEVNMETAALDRRVFALVGWAICDALDDDGARVDEASPVLRPCVCVDGELITAQAFDAFDVLAPGDEADWDALRAEARRRIRARHERDG